MIYNPFIPSTSPQATGCGTCYDNAPAYEGDGNLLNQLFSVPCGVAPLVLDEYAAPAAFCGEGF